MSFLWKSELQFWIYGLMSVLHPVTQTSFYAPESKFKVYSF